MNFMLADIPAVDSLPWPWQAVLRLVVAALLGAAIGAERERRGRAAGFRTLLLVALGSALAMVVSVSFEKAYGGDASLKGVQVDPARVAYGVMAGIGFLGAGVVIQHGTGVRGLTTGASMWCTAAIGLAAGFGLFSIAIAATILVVFALLVLSGLDRAIPSVTEKLLSITLPLAGKDSVERFAALLREKGVAVTEIQCSREMPQRTETITYGISVPTRVPLSSLMNLADEAPEIQRISIQ